MVYVNQNGYKVSAPGNPSVVDNSVDSVEKWWFSTAISGCCRVFPNLSFPYIFMHNLAKYFFLPGYVSNKPATFFGGIKVKNLHFA